MKRFPIMPGSKVEFGQTNRGLEIFIPTEKQWFVVGFLCVWLTGWLMGEIFAVTSIVKILIKTIQTGKISGDIFGMLFLVVWVTFWTIGGFFALRAVLEFLIGNEIITIANDEFKIAYKIKNWGLEKKYKISGIRNLRKADASGYMGAPAENSGLFSQNRIFANKKYLCFDYNQNKIEFGKGLKIHEREKLYSLLKECVSLAEKNFPEGEYKREEFI
ncbi:MAG: hypothetical protein ACLFQV_09725 [Vulcanimicrobiota bacterium]